MPITFGTEIGTCWIFVYFTFLYAPIIMRVKARASSSPQPQGVSPAKNAAMGDFGHSGSASSLIPLPSLSVATRPLQYR